MSKKLLYLMKEPKFTNQMLDLVQVGLLCLPLACFLHCHKDRWLCGTVHYPNYLYISVSL